MGWPRRPLTASSVLLLVGLWWVVDCTDLAVGIPSSTSSTSQQQDGGTAHSAAGCSCMSCQSTGTDYTVTVEELKQCQLCNGSLHRDPYSIAAPSANSRPCQSCLRGNKVDWRSKDYLANSIARVMLKDYLGRVPAEPSSEGRPCVECLLFLLETPLPDFDVHDRHQELQLCGMCRRDDKVADIVPVFVNYQLTSFYLGMHIYSGLPYRNDDSMLAKLLNIMALQLPNAVEDFYEVFLVDYYEMVDYAIAKPCQVTPGARMTPTLARHVSLLVTGHILYPSLQRPWLNPSDTPIKPINKLPPPQAAVVIKAHALGAQGPSKGKPHAAPTGPTFEPLQKSKSGTKKTILQPTSNMTDDDYWALQVLAHFADSIGYKSLARYIMHDARGTPLAYTWLAYSGLFIVLALFVSPTLWFRYQKALDKGACRGRRPPRNVLGFACFSLVEFGTSMKCVLAFIKTCVQAVLTGRCLAWIGSVLSLLALLDYAYTHSKTLEHILETCLPYVLPVTGFSCACISFPRLMKQIIYQLVAWCVGLPLMIGRRLGDVKKDSPQQVDVVHGETLACDSAGQQPIARKQQQTRRRVKGRNNSNKGTISSTFNDGGLHAYAYGSTSSNANIDIGANNIGNNTASHNNMASNTNSSSCGTSTMVTLDVPRDNVQGPQHQASSATTQDTETMEHATKPSSVENKGTKWSVCPTPGSVCAIGVPMAQLPTDADALALATTPALTTPTAATVASSNDAPLAQPLSTEAHAEAAPPTSAPETTNSSSNNRDVSAASGPDIVAPYRPLVLIGGPTTTSTCRPMVRPPSDSAVDVTAPSLKQTAKLAPMLPGSNPHLLGPSGVPEVLSSPASATAPLVLAPPLQLASSIPQAATKPVVSGEPTGSAAELSDGSDACSDVGGEGLCVICWEGELTHGLMHDDCIHLCMCSRCIAKYDHAAHGCPVCRRAGELIEI